MTSVRIPKSFDLFGQHIKVKIEPKLSDRGNFGECTIAHNVVCLEPWGEGPDVPTRNHQEQVFWHEVLHCIFLTMGMKKLASDEAFIEKVSHAIHQVLASSKGDL